MDERRRKEKKNTEGGRRERAQTEENKAVAQGERTEQGDGGAQKDREGKAP